MKKLKIYCCNEISHDFTFCMLSKFGCFLGIIRFFKINFFKISFRFQYHLSVKQYGSRSAGTKSRHKSGGERVV